jgi:dimethylaniline monooxygenase (N-oxide forming)
MKVLVVGIGNSAADTSTQLIGQAQKIYLSHRGGAKIVTSPLYPKILSY